MPGFGPIPAETARDLAFTGTTRHREPGPRDEDDPPQMVDQHEHDGPREEDGPRQPRVARKEDGDPEAQSPREQARGQRRPTGPRAAWIRRLFLSPIDGSVADRDTRRRRFDPAVRELLIARDQHCATPWRDAPIRHADHIERHTGGGPTAPDNGQGLCERCNYDKDTPGFTATADRDPDGRRITRLTTPTGHTYDHHPPPALDGITDLHHRSHTHHTHRAQPGQARAPEHPGQARAPDIG